MNDVFSPLGIEPSFELVNEAQLDSCLSVSELAASAVAAVACSVSELVESIGLVPARPAVKVDQTLASLWFAQSIQPVGWTMPPIWDAIAGDYRTKDGWIKLHTNLPHHRQAALSVLECEPVREQVAAAVVNWSADTLETEVVGAGGVAAALKSREQWSQHEQGAAVALEPLVAWAEARPGPALEWQASLARPLQGLKVLDLTRVLAGPVATRTLAGFGAQVLRIDPPGWDEANVVPDIALGKRCATLDLHSKRDRDIFEGLLSEADVLIHGYRPDALERLGYGEQSRLQYAPNLIEVCLDAYGWTGPWAGRRGFDSLVQMSCGIAHLGMSWANRDMPTPLPVQALDHATGYLMAAAAISAIKTAVSEKRILSARLSLARTAEQLIRYPQETEGVLSVEPRPEHYCVDEEHTSWGPAKRLRPALEIEGIPMLWELPARSLGSEPPKWR